MHSAPPSYNEGYVKIEFPAATGEKPIVEATVFTHKKVIQF
ncbi:hypothetical protein HAPS_0925 [Glaesserella parasuis SH0165]|uniref:Uncharacterized protein n=1 Tax=Glaesserella parasuis serovar 5 (strain SH0165) TaxID=557723 RepID=B8F5F1_GLAP5|nr:hypothetical protein HAPS_0925 [Glaesserella parasuis SH0165]